MILSLTAKELRKLSYKDLFFIALKSIALALWLVIFIGRLGDIFAVISGISLMWLLDYFMLKWVRKHEL